MDRREGWEWDQYMSRRIEVDNLVTIVGSIILAIAAVIMFALHWLGKVS
jgi:hypothetical protein